MAVRVLRLLEYTYDSTETMERDMSRWEVPPTGIKIPHAAETIRSSIICDYNFTPAENVTQGGVQDGTSIHHHSS